jgi:hypothetical protein
MLAGRGLVLVGDRRLPTTLCLRMLRFLRREGGQTKAGEAVRALCPHGRHPKLFGDPAPSRDALSLARLPVAQPRRDRGQNTSPKTKRERYRHACRPPIRQGTLNHPPARLNTQPNALRSGIPHGPKVHVWRVSATGRPGYPAECWSRPEDA